MDKIKQTLMHYNDLDHEVIKLTNTIYLIDNNYIIKQYDDFNMLIRNIKIFNLLYQEGIPVSKIIKTKDEKDYITLDDAYYFMYEKLKGESIKEIKDGSSLDYLMGETIALLHVALKNIESKEEFYHNSLLGELSSWIKESFEKSNYKYINKEEFELIENELASVYTKLEKQLIHRDVHFDNFLFYNNKFSGYIDFDLSQINIRIFDICYFLLSLLSNQEEFIITIDKWKNVISNVISGYQKYIKLNEYEIKAIPLVMKCIELLFIAYFNNINDDQSATEALKIYNIVKNEL